MSCHLDDDEHNLYDECIIWGFKNEASMSTKEISLDKIYVVVM